MYVCMCPMCMHALRVQKKVSDSLELKAVVNHHVGDGNQTMVLRKSIKCSELLSHLSRSHLHPFTEGPTRAWEDE